MPSDTQIRSVDRFLATELEARALGFALSCGWIDELSVRGSVPADELQRAASLPDESFRLLIGLLTANGVIEDDGSVSLTPDFRESLALRDLLEAKLWFAQTVAPDVHQLFHLLLADIPQFMARAQVFELFRYDRCFEVTEENLAATRRWVGYTTVLTKYEAGACLDRLDLDAHRRMLDVGGNSGEFARQACARAPQLQAAVFDLPVVCALGREHLAAFAERDRVDFVPGDLRRQELPGGHDLVSFKSVLHDWPDEDAADFLEKAADALEPGGLMVIFERARIEVGPGRMPYSMVANLVFLPFFRDARFYVRKLSALGFADIRVETVALEMPFHLITARKTA